VTGSLSFLSVAADRRAYLALVYAMLRFPLAVAYLIFFATGLSTALGLLPVGIGLAVLFVVLLGAWGCAVFERELGRWWFGFELRPMAPPATPGRTWWRKALDFALNWVTWRSLLFVVIQIPLGFVYFLVVGVLGTVTLALLAAPLVYALDLASLAPGDSQVNALGLSDGAAAQAATLALAAAGVLLGLATLHVARAIALGYGSLIRGLLGMSQTQLDLAAARTEVATQSARAERSDQSRRELIVNASHELRTPIASIRGHVESLLDPHGGKPSAEETRRYLEIVQKETERLGSLVDDLLAVARAEAGELKLEVRPVDLRPIVEHVAGALAPIALRDRKVTLTTAVAEGVPAAIADPDRLSQVLVNLVRNAINYTPEGGIVSIELAAGDADGVLLAVADTGVGIPAEELDRIFDRLHRVDPSRSRATGGFGLGLAISKDLVQAMGGTIGVASEPGSGSRFTVRLRRA
jgi:two-component system phosphate regulon sensor histidine kinase PhoR